MRSLRLAVVMLAAVFIAVVGGRGLAREDDHAGRAESKNMRLVGWNDLQARSSYQPTLHKQWFGGQTHYVIYQGHHALAGPGEGAAPPGTPALSSRNPLTGRDEPNGVSIVDVTNPRRPQYLFHLPVGTTGNGGAQMVRVCNLGGREYLLRSYASSAHEIWDVTNPSNPQPVRTVAGGNAVTVDKNGTVQLLSGTHKNFWECDTGIAYLVGRRASDTAAGWRPGNHVMIYDLSNPASPRFIRDWAMDGQQPGSSLQPHFTSAPSIHGPISTGPNGVTDAQGNVVLAGNRVFFAYGTGSTGIVQIADRSKLLDSTIPASDYTTAEIGHWVMNPDNGGHTSFPLGVMTVKDFVTDTGHDLGTRRELLLVVSEATANYCADQVRHLTFLVDITDPGRPQSVSTFQVPAASGRFCDRGGRFGPHASNEEFGAPFFQKLSFISYFNGGVRAVDVRDPYNPKDAAFYIPSVNANTDLRCAPYQGQANVCARAVQTNNVATDDRGYVYIADRANSGLHILQLTGDAARIAGLESGDDD